MDSEKVGIVQEILLSLFTSNNEMRKAAETKFE